MCFSVFMSYLHVHACIHLIVVFTQNSCIHVYMYTIVLVCDNNVRFEIFHSICSFRTSKHCDYALHIIMLKLMEKNQKLNAAMLPN